MANKEALRALQSRLAERLQAVREQPRSDSWLAVECRGQGLLLPLAQAGEIFPPAPLMPVPHTLPWFLGVANLRGGLHGVVDFGAFLGLGDGATAAEADQARLVTFGAGSSLNCALQVDRLLGLRHAADLAAEPAAPGARPAFAGPCHRDAQQRLWQEISLSALADDDRFLAVVA
jgi:twitching motility protein PilI